MTCGVEGQKRSTVVAGSQPIAAHCERETAIHHHLPGIGGGDRRRRVDRPTRADTPVLILRERYSIGKRHSVGSRRNVGASRAARSRPVATGRRKVVAGGKRAGVRPCWKREQREKINVT